MPPLAAIRNDPRSIFVLLLLPQIKSRAHAMMSDLDIEAREDAVSDVIAETWRNFQSAARKNKAARLTAYTLTRYAAMNYRNGRRFAGYHHSDALSESSGMAGRAHVVSLDIESPADPNVLLWEALEDPKVEDPAEVTRRKFDWRLIRNRCTPKQREVLDHVARGMRPKEIAKELKVSPLRVQHHLDAIAGAAASCNYWPE